MKVIFSTVILIVAYCQGFAQNQQSADELVDIGYSNYESGDYQVAVEHFTKAVKIAPDNAEAYYLMGVCKSQLNKNLEAIADYNVALKLKPDYPEAYFEKGYAYFLLSDFEKAVASFDEAIRLRPDYAVAFVNRGSVKCVMGKPDEAIEDWEKARSLGAEVPFFECE